MKVIGLIGGMSWESSREYYSIINKEVNARLGKNHSASCIMYSFDFQNIEELQYQGKWEQLEEEIIKAGKSLKSAGAEIVGLCTNTMHKLMDRFEEKVGIPFIHIADSIGEKIKKDGIKRVGLLGTIFTMEHDFYRKRIKDKQGIEVIVPEKEDRIEINRIIYTELVKGIIKEDSRMKYLEIMDKLKVHGAEGIILGCTEIGLLIKNYEIPIYDSTIVHAKKIVEESLLG